MKIIHPKEECEHGPVVFEIASSLSEKVGNISLCSQFSMSESLLRDVSLLILALGADTLE